MLKEPTHPATLTEEEVASIVETSEATMCRKIFDGLPDVYNYIAIAGEAPAAVGTLIVSGDTGALFNGATLPEYRRRGAQGANMARRIREAIARVYRWLTTETGEDTPDASNPSYRNMLRTGFQLAYLRPNYICEFE